MPVVLVGDLVEGVIHGHHPERDIPDERHAKHNEIYLTRNIMFGTHGGWAGVDRVG